MNTQEEVKIFIVEDEPFFANLINYDLEANYYKGIKVFFTGEECIENLHLKPKVVILDHSLPGMSGLEVLQQIPFAEIGKAPSEVMTPPDTALFTPMLVIKFVVKEGEL